ncbi:crotonase/enoyl-CoA hydratase family protein [bacterium CPR1]|nr:crotonase/enoyl-CoA hydratase family protein [bacterium CPR1]
MVNPVRLEKSGPVWTVILDRPEARNAVDRTSADRLAAAFRAFEYDPTARAAVLWGAGGHFSSGADLKAVAEERGNRLEEEGDGPLGPTRMQLTKPVIAAIEGYAVAGGLELALWCDLRVASSEAVLGVFCRRFNVPLIDGGTVRLPRLIGLSRALDMILTGRAVKAEEALGFGLVNRVVPPGQARAAAERLAMELASLPQECLQADRLSAQRQFDLSLEEALKAEFRGGTEAFRKGGPEGARRFLQGEGRGGHPL